MIYIRKTPADAFLCSFHFNLLIYFLWFFFSSRSHLAWCKASFLARAFITISPSFVLAPLCIEFACLLFQQTAFDALSESHKHERICYYDNICTRSILACIAFYVNSLNTVFLRSIVIRSAASSMQHGSLRIPRHDFSFLIRFIWHMVELGEAKDYLRHFRFDDDVSRFVCINWLVISKGWRVSRLLAAPQNERKKNIDLKYLIFFFGAFLPLSPLAWLAQLNFVGFFDAQFFVFFSFTIPSAMLLLFIVSPIENKKKIISTRIFGKGQFSWKKRLRCQRWFSILRKKFESSGALGLVLVTSHKCVWRKSFFYENNGQTHVQHTNESVNCSSNQEANFDLFLFAKIMLRISFLWHLFGKRLAGCHSKNAGRDAMNSISAKKE